MYVGWPIYISSHFIPFFPTFFHYENMHTWLTRNHTPFMHLTKIHTQTVSRFLRVQNNHVSEIQERETYPCSRNAKIKKQLGSYFSSLTTVTYKIETPVADLWRSAGSGVWEKECFRWCRRVYFRSIPTMRSWYRGQLEQKEMIAMKEFWLPEKETFDGILTSESTSVLWHYLPSVDFLDTVGWELTSRWYHSKN